MKRGESILFIGEVFAVSATGIDGLDFGPDLMMILPLPSSPSCILSSLTEFRSGFSRVVL